MGKEVGKSMATVDERVKKIIAEQLGVEEEEVTPEAHFVEDLGADSLDTVELVMALCRGIGHWSDYPVRPDRVRRADCG